jgi:hypothetical protein
MTQCRADTESFLFSDIKSENFKKNMWEKNVTKSIFFPYKNYRPTVRKIPDIVTVDTKSGGHYLACYYFACEEKFGIKFSVTIILESFSTVTNQCQFLWNKFHSQLYFYARKHLIIYKTKFTKITLKRVNFIALKNNYCIIKSIKKKSCSQNNFKLVHVIFSAVLSLKSKFVCIFKSVWENFR